MVVQVELLWLAVGFALQVVVELLLVGEWRPLVVGVGAFADGAVERHPQVARAIHGRPVGVLVVIAGHPPALGVR